MLVTNSMDGSATYGYLQICLWGWAGQSGQTWRSIVVSVALCFYPTTNATSINVVTCYKLAAQMNKYNSCIWTVSFTYVKGQYMCIPLSPERDSRKHMPTCFHTSIVLAALPILFHARLTPFSKTQASDIVHIINDRMQEKWVLVAFMFLANF